jgi:hypothetical protein
MLEFVGVEDRDFTIDLLDFLLIFLYELFIHFYFFFLGGLPDFLIRKILLEPYVPGLLFFGLLNNHRQHLLSIKVVLLRGMVRRPINYLKLVRTVSTQIVLHCILV